MKLVFATHNQNKFDEVKELVPDYIDLMSLKMLGCHEEIPETGDTLEENAQIKADYVTKNYGVSCFSDDTGLLVDSLNGAPGVYTARYGGEQKDAGTNMARLLKELEQTTNRNAHFKTVIALNHKNQKYLFNGIVEGIIERSKKGTGGFGYDPIFRPEGYNQTFGELPLSIKNTISHRGRAVKKLITFLSNLQNSDFK